jgi:hypothetical protein
MKNALLSIVASCAMDNVGREFALAFPEMNNHDLDIEVFVASTGSAANISVWIPSQMVATLQQNIQLNANEGTKLTLPSNLRNQGTGLFDTGIRLTATADVVVFGFNRDASSCGGYTALPIDALGTEYFVLTRSYATSGIFHPLLAEAVVVATEPNTRVHVEFLVKRGITVTYDNEEYDEKNPLVVNMDKAYSVLQIQAEASADLTGTRIYSEGGKKIAVVSGNILTDIKGKENANHRDHVIEQMPPSYSWGESYNVVPLPLASSGSEVKAGVVYSNTTIYFPNDMMSRPTIEAGSHMSEPFDNPIHFTGTGKLFVAQFPMNTCTGPATYPAMILVPPEVQYMNSYRFMVPTQSVASLTNYVIVGIEETRTSGLRLDSKWPGSGNWTVIPDTSPRMVGRAILVEEGVHEIHHITPEVKFMALVYGYSLDVGTCSYGYPAGMCLEFTERKVWEYV